MIRGFKTATSVIALGASAFFLIHLPSLAPAAGLTERATRPIDPMTNVLRPQRLSPFSGRELVRAFEKKSPWLKPGPEAEKLAKRTFDLDLDRHVVIPRDVARAGAFNGIVTLDVPTLLATTGTDDVLSAKRLLQKNIGAPTLGAEYACDRPCLQDWWGLTHPPQASLPAPLELVSRELAEDQRATTARYVTPEFQRDLTAPGVRELTRANRIRISKNGATFDEIKKLARSAQNYFAFSTMYVFCNDNLRPFLEILKERSRSGVQVYMTVDNFIGHRMGGSCLEELTNAGVHIAYSRSRMSSSSHVLHIKAYTADGQRAIVDGENLTDIEVLSTGANNLYRDTGLIIEGPLATDVANEVLGLHHFLSTEKKNADLERLITATETKLKEERASGLRGEGALHRLGDHASGVSDFSHAAETSIIDNTSIIGDSFPVGSVSGFDGASIVSNPSATHGTSTNGGATSIEGTCRLVTQGEHNNQHTITNVLSRYFAAAEKRLLVQTVRRTFRDKTDAIYDDLLRIAEDKGRKGVAVDIVVNGLWTPFLTVPRAGFELGRSLTWLEALFELPNRMNLYARYWDRHLYFTQAERETKHYRGWAHFQYNHSKSFLIDDEVVGIGGYNIFDDRSALNDYEAMVICHDPKLAREYKEMFALDLINSVPIVERSDFTN